MARPTKAELEARAQKEALSKDTKSITNTVKPNTIKQNTTKPKEVIPTKQEPITPTKVIATPNGAVELDNQPKVSISKAAAQNQPSITKTFLPKNSAEILVKNTSTKQVHRFKNMREAELLMKESNKYQLIK